MCKEIKPIKEAVSDLLDSTADEETQRKILRCIGPVYNSFEEFRGIRTRQSGETIYVDLLIGFSPDKPYSEIEEILTVFSNLIHTELPEGKVSIVLQKY